MQTSARWLGRSWRLALATFLLAAAMVSRTAHAQLCDSYNAFARASELVPPLESGARASFWGQFESTCSACRSSWDDRFTIAIHDTTRFSGRPTFLRVHIGGPTENGPLLYEWTFPDQDPYSRSFEVAFSEDHCAALRDTLLYLVIATAAHPEGEARGRIIYDAASPTMRTTWGRVRMLFR